MTRLFSALVLALAALAPPARAERLLIANVPVRDTAADYHRYVKHLTVSPRHHASATFRGHDAQAIRALECPLRRQIFDAMSRNRAEAFAFASLRQARENFDMRVVAIGFMFKVQNGRRGGVDFDYAGPTVPEAADRAHWRHVSKFTFVTRSGTPASESIDGIVRDRFRGECLGAMQVNVLHAARVALGGERFNRLHPKGLDIGPSASSVMPHIREAKSVRSGDMVPGDWVYMKNKDDYGTDLRPGAAPGYWSGENAVYLGKFEFGSDRRAHFGGAATRRYSGMGAYAKSEGELRSLLKLAYLKEMRPPHTLHAHSISDAHVRWYRVDRLVTGG